MADALAEFLKSVAPDSADIAILQPANPFLETAGEDLRRRIFMTQTADGDDKCLRPEFTIPLCLHHIQSGSTNRYAYGGVVFRQARDGVDEFQQAGLEDLGHTDTTDADARCIADMFSALKIAGAGNVNVVLGDQDLFKAVVGNLELPDAITERLIRSFGSLDKLHSIIDGLETGEGSRSGDATALKLAKSGDLAALEAHVSGLMDEAGISPKSGRAPRDVAKRMMDSTRLNDFQLSPERADILRGFLAIEAPTLDAVARLKEFSVRSGVDFGETLTVFARRLAQAHGLGVELERVVYRASFGRKLEYYSGLLFEALDMRTGISIAGGGRYDRLCSLLGSETPVPAVGFSISLDRLDVVEKSAGETLAKGGVTV